MKPPIRVALATTCTISALLAGLALSTMGADSSPTKSAVGDSTLPPPSNGAISPQDQADALHFVIAADRAMLCRLHLAHEPAEAGSSGNQGNDWPCASVALREACESIQSQGADFSYALRSLSPLAARNGPQTDLEREGLTFIASHPGQNYYGREMLGGRRYFTAVYPDIAASASCVDCHNRKAGGTPTTHKVGDPLGAMVVRVPLEF